MAKFSFRMIPNIDSYLFPISFVIANLFTGHANRQKSTQRFHFRKGFLKLLNEFLTFLPLLPLWFSREHGWKRSIQEVQQDGSDKSQLHPPTLSLWIRCPGMLPDHFRMRDTSRISIEFGIRLGNELPRRKQRGIKDHNGQNPSPQGAGYSPGRK